MINVEIIKKSVDEAECPEYMPVKIVAIDGHGGSGKSTLAKKLADKLGAEVLHADDFAFPDHPEKLYKILVETVFEPIKDGVKSLSYSRTKWWPNHNPKPVVNQPVTPVIILEGAGASRKEFNPYLTLRVWVETPKEICLMRGIERDIDQGAREDIKKLWAKWYQEEELFFSEHGGMERADITISGEDSYE